MTQDELLVLAQGRVPAQPILAAVIDHIKGCDDGRVSGPYLEIISTRSGLLLNTLMKWVMCPERQQTLAFDDADRLLCAAYLYGMWYGEFREWYEVVDVTWRKCECPGCEVSFKPLRDTAGKTAPRYCSKACRASATKQRAGITVTRRKTYNGTKTTCRNGHKRTPENTKVHSDGHEECAECVRVAARRRWEKNPTLATHCRQGHEFTRENTMMLKSGKRRCRTCHNATSSAGYTRRREEPVAA